MTTSMDIFKQFLETKGSEIAKTPQCLPYYALPYVADPINHPTFKELFTEKWLKEVRDQLEEFIKTNLVAKEQPQLYWLYHDYVRKSEELRSKLFNPQVENSALVKNIEFQLKNSEARELEVVQKYQILKSNFQRLLNITTDLVQALTASMQGHPVIFNTTCNLDYCGSG
jgi:hypothetical protein